MFKRKNGEAYIDTVITVFLSMIIIYISISMFTFFVTYQKLDNAANQIIDYVALNGETDSVKVKEKCIEFLSNEGFDAADVTLSFENSEYFEDYNGADNVIQYGDKVSVTISKEASIKLVGGDGVSHFPMSITKNKASEKYWK